MTYVSAPARDVVAFALATNTLDEEGRTALYDGEEPNTSHILVFNNDSDVYYIEGDPHELGALMRRLVVSATRVLAGSGARLLPELPLRAQVIAAELHSANLGFTPEEAIMLTDQIDDALHHAGLAIVERASEQAAGPTPSVLHTNTTVTRDLLAPGTIVWREAVTHHGGKDVSTVVPCCGRPLSLTAPDDGQDEDVHLAAACGFCALAYQVSVVEEPDSRAYEDLPSFVAMFTVAEQVLIMAQRRPHKTRTRRPAT